MVSEEEQPSSSETGSENTDNSGEEQTCEEDQNCQEVEEQPVESSYENDNGEQEVVNNSNS
jgi:hypothetical protein